MDTLNVEGLAQSVERTITPFFREILDSHGKNIHSLHVTGSAVTPEYDPAASDINSLCVLHRMDLNFVEFLAPLGKRYRRQKVGAPLIMTPDYIAESLDVFPLEFLDLKLIHITVHGPDILRDLDIDGTDLRRQCEREIKSKLINLRQGYLSSLGDRRLLRDQLLGALPGYMTLFRGIILLRGESPPLIKEEVISALESAAGVDTGVFRTVLRARRGEIKPGREELDTLFEAYYRATEDLGRVIDEMQQ